MGQKTLTLDDYQIEAVEQAADEFGISQSEVFRRIADEGIASMDGLAEWAQKEAEHSRIIQENRPAMRTMHFKQRVYEYLRDTLTNDEGGIAKFPPHPDKVRKHYGESIREAIKKEHPEYQDEYTDHLDEMLDWYEVMHPDTGPADERGRLVEMAAYLIKYRGEGEARQFIESHPGSVDYSPHELLDEARESLHDETWRHEWEGAVGGKPPIDATQARQ